MVSHASLKSQAEHLAGLSQAPGPQQGGNAFGPGVALDGNAQLPALNTNAFTSASRRFDHQHQLLAQVPMALAGHTGAW